MMYLLWLHRNLLPLLGLAFLTHTQPDTAPGFTATGPSGYHDVITVHNTIWALADSGQVRVFGTDGQRRLAQEPGVKVQGLYRNRRGDVVLFDDHRAVTLVDGQPNQRRELRFAHALPPDTYGVVDNSRGQFFAICDAGLVALTTGRTYRPSSSPNSQYRLQTNWGKPSTYFIDSADRIWVGFGYGEWGGNLFVFDTRTSRFVPLDFTGFRPELKEVESIFEGNATVYVTTGMNHMMASGSVLAFQDLKGRTLLQNPTRRDTLSGTKDNSWRTAGEYIQAGAFDPRTNSLYFASQHGIFRGDGNADLSQFSTWQLLQVAGNPRTTIGFPSRIAKLTFTDDGHLVFLARHFGIGVFDGQALRIIE